MKNLVRAATFASCLCWVVAAVALFRLAFVGSESVTSPADGVLVFLTAIFCAVLAAGCLIACWMVEDAP